MSDCIFCKIVAGEVPAEEIYRDDDVIAILDVNPQAPKHLLVLPRKHYATLAEIVESKEHRVAGSLFRAATKLAREVGGQGYRMVVNSGEQGGQTVDHAHVHVLAGRQMHWPPG